MIGKARISATLRTVSSTKPSAPVRKRSSGLNLKSHATKCRSKSARNISTHARVSVKAVVRISTGVPTPMSMPRRCNTRIDSGSDHAKYTKSSPTLKTATAVARSAVVYLDKYHANPNVEPVADGVMAAANKDSKNALEALSSVTSLDCARICKRQPLSNHQPTSANNR